MLRHFPQVGHLSHPLDIKSVSTKYKKTTVEQSAPILAYLILPQFVLLLLSITQILFCRVFVLSIKNKFLAKEG